MKHCNYLAILLASLCFSTVSMAETSQIYSEDIIQEQIDKNDWHFYQLDVDNPSKLTIKLRKISDDVDLYVARSQKPTEDAFICAPQKSGKLIETCRLNSAIAGIWYIGVHGKSDSKYQLGVRADNIELISQILIIK